MCNLYSYTKPQDAALKLARVTRDITGNMPRCRPSFQTAGRQ